MGNNSVNTNGPLLSPQQLWSKPAVTPRPSNPIAGAVNPQTPTQLPGTLPVTPNQQPTQLPGYIPSASPQATTPTYTPPADSIPNTLPPQGSSQTQLPFTQQTLPTQPTQPAQPVPPVQQQPTVAGANPLSQLNQMFKSGDDSLLGKYGVQLAKDPQGAITGYFVNNQPVTPAQLQQHLLPHASFLHQELENLKATVDGSYTSVYNQMQQAYGSMTPTEQQSISIQMQALHVVYESFVNRLNQIDGLIR